MDAELIAQPWSLREEGFRVHIGTPGETTIPSFKVVADGHVITTVYSREVGEHLVRIHNEEAQG